MAGTALHALSRWAASTRAPDADPWCVGSGSDVTATCGGAAVPVAWTGVALSIVAPRGVDCGARHVTLGVLIVVWRVRCRVCDTRRL